MRTVLLLSTSDSIQTGAAVQHHRIIAGRLASPTADDGSPELVFVLWL